MPDPNAPALLLLADGPVTTTTRFDSIAAAVRAAETARLERQAPEIAVYRCVAEWHQSTTYDAHHHEELPR
ncbi:MAG: hypothetical protein ACYC3L_01280 [Gemmatimonadaceae bacterium]